MEIRRGKEPTKSKWRQRQSRAAPGWKSKSKSSVVSHNGEFLQCVFFSSISCYCNCIFIQCQRRGWMSFLVFFLCVWIAHHLFRAVWEDFFKVANGRALPRFITREHLKHKRLTKDMKNVKLTLNSTPSGKERSVVWSCSLMGHGWGHWILWERLRGKGRLWEVAWAYSLNKEKNLKWWRTNKWAERHNFHL